MRVWLVGKHFLHDCAVKPSTVFAADLALDADLLKAEGCMESERAFATCFDSGNDRMESGIARDIKEAREEQLSDASSLLIATNVDGILHCGSVSRAVAIGAERCKTDHSELDIVGHDDREGTATCSNPLALFFHRTWYEIEGADLVCDFVVVYRRDCLGIARFSSSKRQRLHQAVV